MSRVFNPRHVIVIFGVRRNWESTRSLSLSLSLSVTQFIVISGTLSCEFFLSIERKRDRVCYIIYFLFRRR